MGCCLRQPLLLLPQPPLQQQGQVVRMWKGEGCHQLLHLLLRLLLLVLMLLRLVLLPLLLLVLLCSRHQPLRPAAVAAAGAPCAACAVAADPAPGVRPLAWQQSCPASCCQ